MQRQQIVNILTGYEADLLGILNGFKRSKDGSYHMAEGDESKYKRIVFEVRDLLTDALGDNEHSKLIATHFNQSVSTYTGTPSKRGVEDVLTVVTAAKTRFVRNVNILEEAKGWPEVSELAYPEKVTLKWLFAHVPWHVWVSGGALLIAAFLVGIKAADLEIVKSIISALKT